MNRSVHKPLTDAFVRMRPASDPSVTRQAAQIPGLTAGAWSFYIFSLECFYLQRPGGVGLTPK